MIPQPQWTRARAEPIERRVVLSAYGYDNTFGDKGIAEAPHVEDVQSGAAVFLAQLSDGDILVANQSDTFVGDFQHALAISRFSSDGTLDTSFGTAGTVNFIARLTEAAAIGPDDKLVVAGQLTTANDSAFVARFNADGRLDTTFDGDGISAVPFGSVADQLVVKQIAVAADGTITVFSHAEIRSAELRVDYMLHRFTAAGELDTSFSADGIFTGGRDDLKNEDRNAGVPVGGSMSIDDQGRAVITFLVEGGTVVARLTTGGELDTSFDSDGFALVPGVRDGGTKLAFQDDGKILVAGWEWLARLTEGGQLDATFGTNGVVPHSDFNVGDLVVGADGRIMLLALKPGTAVHRFLPDGSPDPTFAADSRILASRVGRNVHPERAFFLDDGKILGGGEATDSFVGPPFTPRARGVARFVPEPDVFIDDDKTLQVRGTSADDTVVLEVVANELQLTRNAETFTYSLDEVERAHIFLGDGDNTATLSVPFLVVITGGSGEDMFDGRATTGPMFAHGRAGSDTALGGSAGDEIDAGGGDNVVDGGAGRDFIRTLEGGNNSVTGGDGNDRVDCLGDGDDTIMGGDGDDDIRGGDGDNVIHGGEGNDRIKPGAGNDTIHGDSGDDRILAGDGQNLVFGGDGGDYIQSGSGDDTVWAETGYDSIKAGAGDDLVNGGAGKDRVWGQQGNDRIYGRRGSDAIDGGPGSDRLFGDEGEDKLFDADGARDLLSGGAGDDTSLGNDANDLLLDVESTA